MSVDVILEEPAWGGVGLERLAGEATEAVLARLGLEPSAFGIALLACNDARIATLNAEFRGKGAATNVLSWPSADRTAAVPGEMPLPPDPADPELGDIALAFETCAAEARAAGLPLARHATHLIVHGTLHLLGFDHETEQDAALMEGLETEILGNLGLPDPYSQPETETR